MHKRTKTMNIRQLKALSVGGGYIFFGTGVRAREFLRIKAVTELGGKYSVKQDGPVSTITRIE